MNRHINASPESTSNESRHNKKVKTGAVIAAAVLVGGAAVGAFEHFVTHRHEARQVLEERANANAKKIADELNSTIPPNKGDLTKAVTERVIKGTIELPDPLTSSITLKYYDVFPLALDNQDLEQNVTTDMQGAFLENGWVGLQEADVDRNGKPTGKIKIYPVEYNANTMRFIPAVTESDQILQNEWMIAVAVKGGPGFDEYAARTFDPQDPSKVLMSTDIPAFAKGMK